MEWCISVVRSYAIFNGVDKYANKVNALPKIFAKIKFNPRNVMN